MGELSGSDETRIDRWLCAVRLVKTRPMATQLCEAGHVLVNGNSAKPSTKVRPGDRVDALIGVQEVWAVNQPDSSIRTRDLGWLEPSPTANGRLGREASERGR